MKKKQKPKTYWDMVIDEVMHRDVERPVYLTNLPKITNSPKLTPKISYTTPKPVSFKISKKQSITLSKREGECVWYALQGKTMRATAIFLGLSARTVEYYLNRVKNKLSCSNKKELVNIVKNSNFCNKFIAIQSIEI